MRERQLLAMGTPKVAVSLETVLAEPGEHRGCSCRYSSCSDAPRRGEVLAVWLDLAAQFCYRPWSVPTRAGHSTGDERMEQAYEPPAIVELGSVAEVTLGSEQIDVGDVQGVGGGIAGSIGLT